MSRTLSIIIPIYNEADGIPHLVSTLNSFFDENNEIPIEIIFVNDGSSDASLQILENQKIKSFKSKIISFSKNFGSHAALRAGILHSSSELVTFTYADLQDPLELIYQLYDKCNEGYDIVWATRAQTNNSIFETIFSRSYAKLMQKFAYKDFPDKGFDIVCFSKSIKEELNKNIEANSNIFLQILGFGFKQSTIYYTKNDRKIGKSKWTFSKKIKLMIDSFVAFSYAPIRLVSFVGILFFMIGIFWTLYIVSRKLLYNDVASGWPALTSILLLGFGITNIGLGIIAEYLWRTLDASRKRPVFIIDKIIELQNVN